MNYASLHLRIKVVLFTVMSLLLAGTSYSQSRIRITEQIEKESRGDAPYLGRDLWLAIPQNYDPKDVNGEIFSLYVTSEKNTTVNIQVSGQAVVKKPVAAGQVLTHVFPRNLEINRSSAIETDKAIHIWSDNADLSVYFMSRNDFTSDGMYVIPTTGWGKDYVVAAATALYVSAAVDLPSEFIIIANQDNTAVSIIPSQDIRKEGDPSGVLHAKGVPFTEFLKKGECIQYQTTQSQDVPWDLSGTVVTSNNPIGVIGASACPFLPADPYCDHVNDYIPPVRTWSNTYYTTQFVGRKWGGDSFLIVASKAGQLIYRNGNLAATLGRYESYNPTDITGSNIWTSDAPFMLVQYINSATYGVPVGQPRNTGDPAMVVVNPAEQFAKTVIFQTPNITPGSGQSAFVNYVNVLLRTSSVPNTTMDGRLLTSYTPINRSPIPGTGWEALRIEKVLPGRHKIVSDSGVGVYIYGYGPDDSYAWAGALGTKTVATLDTVPPTTKTLTDCFCARVNVYDIHPDASKLSSVTIDSLDNTTFLPDPDFIPGGALDSSWYEFCIIDSSKPAYIVVSVYDIAGNRTTITSTYEPQIVSLSPDPVNFGTGNIGQNSYDYVIITNTGSVDYQFKDVNFRLGNGTLGFYVDSTGGDGPIPPGGTRKIRIRFNPIFGNTVTDTVLFGDECTKFSSKVIGNGGAADFVLLPFDFECALPGKPKSSQGFKGGFKIINNSAGDVTIDSIYLDNVVNFGYDRINPPTNTVPFIVPKQNITSGEYEVVFTFTPSAPGPYTTLVHIHGKSGTSDIGWKTAELLGTGCAPNTTTVDSAANIICDGSVVFPIIVTNSGNEVDSIFQVVHTGAPRYGTPVLTDVTGIVTLPYALQPDVNNPLTATISFNSGTQASGLYTDVVSFLRKNGDTAAKSLLQVDAKYRIATVTKAMASYPGVPFGSGIRQDSVSICNNGPDPITISTMTQDPSPDFASFSVANIYKVNGVTVPLPHTLAVGECMQAVINFDASVSTVPLQLGNFSLNSTDGCTKVYPVTAQGTLVFGVPSITGMTVPTILSCTNRTDSIKVFNPKSGAKEVTNIRFTGSTPANFAYTGTYPIPLPDSSNTFIPVTFTPTQGVGVTSYSANAVVTMRDPSSGAIIIDSAIVQGTSAGIDITVSSVMADISASAGEEVSLPVKMNYNKQGGVTTDISAIDIRKVVVRYSYNTDLLHIDPTDVAGAVLNEPANWSVDPLPANTFVDEANRVLQITFVGTTPLSDNITQLGNIIFKVMLPKMDSVTDVTLTSSEIYQGGAALPTVCASVATTDSNFTLIYRCGDASLQKFMQDGNYMPTKIAPITPNPVFSGVRFVTFNYATRFEGRVTFEILDELGVLVARPVVGQNMSAGEYRLSFDPSHLASGVYTARISLEGNGTSSTRFVVQK
jgi:hypothetical protein